MADLYGDGGAALAVVTHDQGVVATVRPMADGSYQVTELDQQPDTFVHEVEVGDLDGDGVLEIYATPSPPNKLDGTPQPGEVTRYVPATGEGRRVVADLGDRHAKEILVEDVDGDGTDELYVVDRGGVRGPGRDHPLRRRHRPCRRRRHRHPRRQALPLPDRRRRRRRRPARDSRGGAQERAVAAAPGRRPSGRVARRPRSTRTRRASSTPRSWPTSTSNGTDELYVANDDDAEVNRYLWVDGEPLKETLYTYPAGLSGFTWNIMPAPVDLLP